MTSEETTIVFVGDSLVGDGDWQAWLPGNTVINQGVSGATTDDVLADIDRIADTRPDEILLLIGTNDLAMRRSVEHLVRNVESLLVELRRALPGARMLVHSILPRARDYTADIQQANIHLRQFCATVNAQYLDLWPVLDDGSGQLDDRYTEDELHLNDAGYQAWVGELLPALERLRESPPMSRPISVVTRDPYARPDQAR